MIYKETEKGKNRKEKFVCYKCSSDDIDIEAWVNINTLELTDIIENGEAYCNKCEMLTRPIKESKFKKQIENDTK